MHEDDDDGVRTAVSAINAARPLGYGLIARERGPFDEPPAEVVELDPEALPWELRDAEGDTSSAQ